MLEKSLKSGGFPIPKGGASLVLSFRLQSKTVLILGSGPLAASRAFSALEADSTVVILTRGGPNSACQEIQWRAQHNQLTVLDLDSLPGTSAKTCAEDRDAEALESFLSASSGISLVCVTDSILGDHRRTNASAARIYQVCKTHNIPVNITDMPDLCDFSFTSTHRFDDGESGDRTALQIGVTTNGQGCRLAGRVKREIVARLPREVGTAVEKVGELRDLAKAANLVKEEAETVMDEGLSEENGISAPNLPVPPRSDTETALESVRRRMKWVAQVSEYWPLQKLAKMSKKEMTEVLSGEDLDSSAKSRALTPSVHSLAILPPGKILLVGSGPGHPSLLTVAAHTALTKLANLVLSDKLVPAAVLALIPAGVQIRIAKKFPGNAEGAQNEMMEAAVEAAKQGLIVVRLKQGDPVVYGRAGEEVLYFRSHGIEPVIIPGVSSALAAPTFAGIPVTQRGVAQSFIVCTGVGRAGKDVQLPGYERERTLVILMGVARLPQVIEALLDVSSSSSPRRSGAAYPSHTPIALIERASMPDQRVISSTLRDIVQALECVREQRPPGMLVVGWAVLALLGPGDVSVLEEAGEAVDGERVRRWLGGDGAIKWRVKEGLDKGWEEL